MAKSGQKPLLSREGLHAPQHQTPSCRCQQCLVRPAPLCQHRQRRDPSQKGLEVKGITGKTWQITDKGMEMKEITGAADEPGVVYFGDPWQVLLERLPPIYSVSTT
jgi:hypothetical protein